MVPLRVGGAAGDRNLQPLQIVGLRADARKQRDRTRSLCAQLEAAV
jgi:hypothetical protein